MTEDQWDAWLAARIAIKRQRRHNWSAPSPSDGDSHPTLFESRAMDPATSALIESLRRADWMAEGNCRGLDPNLMIPEDAGGTARAKQVCIGCPVIDTCLETALSRGREPGVWGGTSSLERRHILRSRKTNPKPLPPINHGTNAGFNTHYRRGETPCAECHAANAKQRRKAAA